jgi:hypothetical protein
MPGSEGGGSSASTGSGSDAAGTGAEAGDGASSEPGFGDMAGGADLPSMVDTLPTFDEDYGSEGDGSGAEGGSPEGSEDGAGGAGDSGQVAQSSGAPGDASGQQGPGTRASGGMESDMGAGGPMTAAEQVAILDRQLEESTRDFDGIIYDEEQRQREAARERATQTAGSAIDPTESEEPNFGGGMASAGSGSVGGGIGGRSGAPPTDGAKYPPPADIPNGNDDDVVARQLREAAMREPDPAIREKLWAEYRKYKGIAEPDA